MCDTLPSCSTKKKPPLSVVCLRHPEKQDQLPSPSERQEHEEPPAGEAERLQPTSHHHVPPTHQQQQQLAAATLIHHHQHHDATVTDAVAGLH